MRIYIKDNTEQVLEIEFTDTDMEQEFFTTTTLKVLSKYEGELLNNTLRITPTESQRKEDIALLVNEIRQDYMGDIPGLDVPNNCPRLGFTPEPEPEVDPEFEI